MSKQQFTSQNVQHIAQLANIPVTSQEEVALAKAFEETIDVVANMSKLDTQNVSPTHQVTGLENAWREDQVEETRSFTQKQALANAAKSHQGYFVVPQIIDQDE